jgi:hypothetical protein
LAFVRRLVVILVAAVVSAGVGFALQSTVTSLLSPSAATATTLASFLRLAEHGMASNYEAAYSITSPPEYPGTSWTVTVAHRDGTGERGWMLDGGQWSFFVHVVYDIDVQLVETGGRYADCIAFHRGRRWHCGQGTTEASNGFIMATLPFVPGTMLDDLSDISNPLLGRHEHQVTTFTTRASAEFGRLYCLAVRRWFTTRYGSTHDASSATMCYTAAGLPESVASAGYSLVGTWTSIVLMNLRMRASAQDFELVSKPSHGPLLAPF